MQKAELPEPTTDCRPSEFTAIPEATAASVPGFLCQSGRRRPENVSLESLNNDDSHGNENGTKVIGLGCVRLGNLDLDFKIRISDLQSNAKFENGFQR